MVKFLPPLRCHNTSATFQHERKPKYRAAYATFAIISAAQNRSVSMLTLLPSQMRGRKLPRIWKICKQMLVLYLLALQELGVQSFSRLTYRQTLHLLQGHRPYLP